MIWNWKGCGKKWSVGYLRSIPVWAKLQNYFGNWIIREDTLVWASWSKYSGMG